MKRKICLIIIVFASLLPAVLITGCKDEKPRKDADGQKQTYTCPMHPQIIQDKPGTCPICGMDLVLFDRNNTDPSLMLNESQQILANISTVIIGNAALSNNKQLNGRIVADPSQTSVISSRVAGRIETLYVRETGVSVTKGQPLYKIYSEQLGTLQQEYLIAVAQLKEFPNDEKFIQIEKAAKQKLMLYDQSSSQVEQLVRSQKISPYVTYPATFSGIVSELSISEGQYVAEGAAIMRIENYGKLWVEADLYPAEASLVKQGQVVRVIMPGWENEPQQMKIEFINPSLQPGSQLLQVRGTIPNINNQWQPGLQANIILPIKTGSNALTIPADAVIRDAKGSLVWLETAKGKFQPKMVETGVENADFVEITKGIKEGDKVVVSGAYLLNSEYILKKGSDPMQGHNH